MHFSNDPIHTTENLVAKNKTKSISIYILVVLAVATIIGLLPVIEIDISSQSRGVVRSKTENVPITSLVNGRLVSVAIQNNVLVQKGDTLFTISKEVIETEKEIQDTLSSTLEENLKDIIFLLKGKTDSLQTTSKREEYYKFTAQKNELQSKVSQAQINYNRYKILYDKQVIAKAEYEKYVYELRFAKQALQSFINQQKANWENQKRELEERVKDIEGSIEKIEIESTNYTVVAPISGTIERFTGLQIGSFINASQTIAYLSPTDNLIVESTVSPNDIGLLKINQEVKYQIDAFNYNQWGLLKGEVIDIDQNITLQENQAFFKVRSSLKTKEMQLKSGYKTQVTKGMTLTSRYSITRRSLFDLLFDKVDDWLNPKQLESSS